MLPSLLTLCRCNAGKQRHIFQVSEGSLEVSHGHRSIRESHRRHYQGNQTEFSALKET